jgi:hypothetical protein
MCFRLDCEFVIGLTAPKFWFLTVANYMSKGNATPEKFAVTSSEKEILQPVARGFAGLEYIAWRRRRG